jgi:hypothetical protein
MKKFDKRTRENVCKLIYLAQQYPEKKITERDPENPSIDIGISGIFQTSPADFNVAVWAAQDLGYLELDKDMNITIKATPKNEEFGELIEHLLDIIPYAIGRINRDEADIEENYFGNWTAGYPAHDVMIAVKKLLADGKIATYKVNNVTEIKPNREQRRAGMKEETVTDTYIFYTLPENLDKRWGEKQFEDPEKLQTEEA